MELMKVTAPVAGVNTVIAGARFADSVATTDDPGAVAYFRRQGYKVEPASAPEAEADDSAAQASGSPAPEDRLPAKGDTKAVWKAYAIGKGMSEAEAEATTRDALAAKYYQEKEGEGK